MRLQNALRPGGIMIFSCLLDGIPIMPSHRTPDVTPSSETEVRSLMSGWHILDWEVGEITEDHLPLVALHRHEVLWCVAACP